MGIRKTIGKSGKKSDKKATKKAKKAKEEAEEKKFEKSLRKTTIDHTIGEPPKDEPKEVRRKWKYLVSIVEIQLTPAHRESFLNLAKSLCELEELDYLVNSNAADRKYVVTNAGEIKPSGIERHRVYIRRQCIELLKEFGLSPNTMKDINRKRN